MKQPPRTGLEAFLYRDDPDWPSLRLWMCHPFMVGDKVCATNGHILIEVSSSEIPIGDEPPDQKHLDKINSWLGIRQADCEFVSLPSLPNFKPCELCSGDGRLEGKKGTTCEGCDGYGESWRHIPIGNTHFCIRYVRLLSSLPGIKIAPNGKEAAPFMFDGGRGLLMPMRGLTKSTSTDAK